MTRKNTKQVAKNQTAEPRAEPVWNGDALATKLVAALSSARDEPVENARRRYLHAIFKDAIESERAQQAAKELAEALSDLFSHNVNALNTVTDPSAAAIAEVRDAVKDIHAAIEYLREVED